MSMSVMDCRQGYACKVNRTQEIDILVEPSLIPSQVFPILKITLQAKVISKLTQTQTYDLGYQ